MPNPLMTMMQTQPNNQNPFLTAINMLKNGKNPQALIKHMVSQNPQLGPLWQQAQQMAKDNPQAAAQKICQEKGLNFNEFAKQFGFKNT